VSRSGSEVPIKENLDSSPVVPDEVGVLIASCDPNFFVGESGCDATGPFTQQALVGFQNCADLFSHSIG
jgi:hypothetical protein